MVFSLDFKDCLFGLFDIRFGISVFFFNYFPFQFRYFFGWSGRFETLSCIKYAVNELENLNEYKDLSA